MIAWLKRLFRRHAVLEGWWCTKDIKFDNAIRTPLGSRITIVNVCVDIWFEIKDGALTVHRVKLYQGELKTNMMSPRKGESWQAKDVHPDDCLYEAVQADLDTPESNLPRMLLRRWEKLHPPVEEKGLVTR